MADARGGSYLTRLGVVAALGAFILVFLVANTASAVNAERLSSFGPDGSEATDFEKINAVARDEQSGAVYVLDGTAGALYRFNSLGQPLDFEGTAPYISGNHIDGIDAFSIERGEAQVAVDSSSHVIYVTEKEAIRAFEADGEPFTFTAGPGVGSNEIPGFSELLGVAVDPAGNIYASDRAGTVSIHDSTGASITSFSTPSPSNIAVNTNGIVYVVPAITTGHTVRSYTPSKLPVDSGTTYTESPGSIAAPAIPDGIGIDSVTSDVYLLMTNFDNTWIHRYSASGAFLDSIGDPNIPNDGDPFGNFAQGIAVIGGGESISESETIDFYIGNTKTGSDGSSKVEAFGRKIKIGAPDVSAVTTRDVTADSATLQALIRPNTAETVYHFEYGPKDCEVGPCSSVPLDSAGIGDGTEFMLVSQAIMNLQPGTTYHFRVVAENEFGPTLSPDRTFTTQSLGLGFGLIDSRVWEMVSPPNKLGGQLVFIGLGGPRQAAADGNGVAYLSRGAIEEPDGNRALENSAVLARRSDDGWASEDIMPPNDQVAGFDAGDGSEYKLFSPDLSGAILSQRSGTLLSPQASGRTIYLRENTQPPLYTPLVTDKEGFANVPLGTPFGGDEKEGPSPLSFGGATPSFSHVVVISDVPLVADGPVAETAAYLWRPGEQIAPVSVLPDAEGGTWASDFKGIGSFQGSMEHAISDDGARIFWNRGLYHVGGNFVDALYVRDTVAEETTRLDVKQEGASGTGTSHPVFLGASADGTVVIFKDSRQLTADASPEGFDLYRCEIPPGPATSGCASITNISVPVNAGESAEVLGLPAGLGAGGKRIYFVARGVLDEAPNQYGDSASAGEPNLYVWQEGEGARFIASLPEGDGTNWGEQSSLFPAQSRGLSPLASPSGRYLSFMSKRSLTGYVNLDESSGGPAQEVFRYDAVADALDCVSCNPSGAAPKGEEVGPDHEVLPQFLWRGQVVAATIPERVNNASLPFYYPRAVLDNGRVFFNAIDSLVPADSNGNWDVYQYEPLGVGGCGPASGDAATALSAGGCVSLLSSGTAEKEAGFFDASVTGDDVFFLTPARLSVTDKDDQLDLYDARVNGVAATLQPSTECQGEACQPPAVAPQDPTPGSATFQGKGNSQPKAAKTCAKGKHKVRRKGKVRCVPRKHHKHQHRDRRAGQSGRARR